MDADCLWCLVDKEGGHYGSWIFISLARTTSRMSNDIDEPHLIKYALPPMKYPRIPHDKFSLEQRGPMKPTGITMTPEL